MTAPRVVVLAFDASWTGTGWCLADQHGPLRCGHLALGPARRRTSKSHPWRRTYREAKLREWLAGPMAHVLADAMLDRQPQDPLVRVAVEVPPVAFKGGQATAYVAVGRLVGALELWGTRSSLGVPWVQEPGDWRAWWGIAPTGRRRDGETLKAEAIHQVRARWGREWLEPYDEGPRYRRKGAPAGCYSRKAGPRGDVAEAILLGVGSAQHHDEAPAYPATWPSAPAGTTYP